VTALSFAEQVSPPGQELRFSSEGVKQVHVEGLQSCDGFVQEIPTPMGMSHCSVPSSLPSPQTAMRELWEDEDPPEERDEEDEEP
jgi:hypothetical protein